MVTVPSWPGAVLFNVSWSLPYEHGVCLVTHQEQGRRKSHLLLALLQNWQALAGRVVFWLLAYGNIPRGGCGRSLPVSSSEMKKEPKEQLKRQAVIPWSNGFPQIEQKYSEPVTVEVMSVLSHIHSRRSGPSLLIITSDWGNVVNFVRGTIHYICGLINQQNLITPEPYLSASSPTPFCFCSGAMYSPLFMLVLPSNQPRPPS